MPKFSDLIVEAETAIAKAVAWYGALPEPLAVCTPIVLAEALRLAGNDAHRLTAEPDGAIIVWNRPVW